MRSEIRAELIPGRITASDDHLAVIIIGGYSGPPSWNKYVESHKEDLRPFLQEIRKCIIREGLIGAPAETYAVEYHFEFEDGSQYTFNAKGWNDIQRALGGIKEPKPRQIWPWIFVAILVSVVIYLLATR